MKSTNFKIGQKVKIIKVGTLGRSCNYTCCKRFIGKIGEIKDIERNGKIFVYPIEGIISGSRGCSGFSAECLQAVGGNPNNDIIIKEEYQ